MPTPEVAVERVGVGHDPRIAEDGFGKKGCVVLIGAGDGELRLGGHHALGPFHGFFHEVSETFDENAVGAQELVVACVFPRMGGFLCVEALDVARNDVGIGGFHRAASPLGMKWRFLLPGTSEPRLTLQRARASSEELALLTRRSQLLHSCHWQLSKRPANGGTIPGNRKAFTPSSILFRPHEPCRDRR